MSNLLQQEITLTYLTYSASPFDRASTRTPPSHSLLGQGLASCQLTLAFFRSCRSWSVEHLLVFLGWPAFLFPCGLKSKACPVMLFVSFLRVCPIQFHFLLLMVVAMLSWFVFLHNSSFVVLMGHHSLRMYRRHLLARPGSCLWGWVWLDHVFSGLSSWS